MRALKITVIGMGVLLVVGLAVVVVTLVIRGFGLGESGQPEEAVIERLALEPGDRVAAATLDGYQALLVVDRSAGHQDVLVVDTRTGLVTLTLTGAVPDADTEQVDRDQ